MELIIIGQYLKLVQQDKKVHKELMVQKYIRRFAKEEWGVSESQADRYLARARDIIRADYSVDRSDFLGSRLALLDEIIEASISTKQHSNAVGALKLQAQLTRLLEGNS